MWRAAPWRPPRVVGSLQIIDCVVPDPDLSFPGLYQFANDGRNLWCDELPVRERLDGNEPGPLMLDKDYLC